MVGCAECVGPEGGGLQMGVLCGNGGLGGSVKLKRKLV